MQPSGGLQIHLPCNIIITGATNCGKTHLTLDLLKNKHLFNPRPQHIAYLYKHYQPQFDQHTDHIKFINSLRDFTPTGEHTILIVDDFLMQLTDEIVNYFIAGRHRAVSVIFLTQNIYHNDPRIRTINGNTAHYVFLKSPRTAMQIETFSRQSMAKESRANLLQAYHDAVKSRYGYLWVNLDARADPNLIATSNICPSDGTFPSVYKL